MISRTRTASLVGALALIALTACQDVGGPTSPTAPPEALTSRAASPQDLTVWFERSAPEVLALPRAVFADHDEAGGRLVFGVENAATVFAAQRVLAALGVPTGTYELRVVEPIGFASTTLRTSHRPTVGGLQIHWSQYVCTLGFNVDHAGGRSFITNSHCTDNQGSTGSTAYYQPERTAGATPIAIEAHDPAYGKGGGCPRGRVCRRSDASRALYEASAGSTRGLIAKTTGENTGSLEVASSFTIETQNNTSTSFSGTLHKVGRTTGWTSGEVSNTCVSVNVSGSNITLLCQTIVERSGVQIVAGGDSGSPVFRRTSGDAVELAGILWGGSTSGSLFVFSPLKNIQDELGGMTATSDGTGGSGSDDGGGDGDGGGGTCIPRGPNGNNCK